MINFSFKEFCLFDSESDILKAEDVHVKCHHVSQQDGELMGRKASDIKCRYNEVLLSIMFPH